MSIESITNEAVNILLIMNGKTVDTKSINANGESQYYYMTKINKSVYCCAVSTDTGETFFKVFSYGGGTVALAINGSSAPCDVHIDYAKVTE